MNAKVLSTPEADADLLEIWVHIAEDNFDAATRVLIAINARCECLADNPEMGRHRDDLSPSLQSITEGRYVIFYRVRDDIIRIVRVLHGARDLRHLFA